MSKEKKGSIPTVFIKDDEQVIKRLNRNRESYIIEMTNSTSIIKTNNCKYVVSPNTIKPKFLNFIVRVKKNAEFLAESGQKEYTAITPQHIGYFRFYETVEGLYYNINEVDVNGAYWQIAYQMGYITKELFLEGLEVPKMVRLVALGAMATIKKIYEVTPENGAVLVDIKENKITRSFFFDIAKRLDEIMERVIDNIGSEHFYLYWVDAFFCNSYAKKHIKIEMEKEGLKCKDVIISTMLIKREEKNEKRVYMTEIKERNISHTKIKTKHFTIGGKDKKRTELKSKFLETLQEIEKENEIKE